MVVVGGGSVMAPCFWAPLGGAWLFGHCLLGGPCSVIRGGFPSSSAVPTPALPCPVAFLCLYSFPPHGCSIEFVCVLASITLCLFFHFHENEHV